MATDKLLKRAGINTKYSIYDFIDAVKEHHIIWNREHDNFHNHDLRDNAWRQIGRKLCQNFEAASVTERQEIEKQLKKKWKNVRDQFRKEYQKMSEKSGFCIVKSEEQYETFSTWKPFKTLLFLKDHVKHGKENPDDLLYTSTYQESFGEQHDSEDSFTIKTEDPVNKRLRGNGNSSIATDTSILNSEQREYELFEQRMNDKGETKRNDDEAFFESLLPYMKTMDMHQKLLCRMEIQRIVYNFAYPNPEQASAAYQYNSENTS